jgi:hypothetical protein
MKTNVISIWTKSSFVRPYINAKKRREVWHYGVTE